MMNLEISGNNAKNQLLKFKNLVKEKNITDAPKIGSKANFSFTDTSQVKRLLSNQILINLPDDDFVRLLPEFELVSLRQGQQLDDYTNNFSGIYFPEDAVISNLHILSHGATIETSMVGKEGLVGLDAVFDLSNPTMMPHVTIPGRALRVRGDVIKREFYSNPSFQRLLLNYLHEYHALISRRTGCIAFHWAISRFCTWLLMLKDRVGSNRLSLTQDQISQSLGVHRPSITHAAQSLRDEGLIDYSRGHITLKNIAGLKKSACDCYSEEVFERESLSGKSTEIVN